MKPRALWMVLVLCGAPMWTRDAAAQGTTQPRPAEAMTARQVIDRLQKELKGTWSETGIDSFKDGDAATPVTGRGDDDVDDGRAPARRRRGRESDSHARADVLLA